MSDIVERLRHWTPAGDASVFAPVVEAAAVIEALRADKASANHQLVQADLELDALRAENARLREALNGLVVAVDWEATAIIGGADDAVTRAQILQACARAAMGETE